VSGPHTPFTYLPKTGQSPWLVNRSAWKRGKTLPAKERNQRSILRFFKTGPPSRFSGYSTKNCALLRRSGQQVYPYANQRVMKALCECR